ncbi:MAG: SRPBCC family protein [Myxococcales bacterium]
MAFEITKTFTVKAPASHVWDFLVDPHRVASCLPGAAIGDKLDDKTYTGTMTVKVGPVSSSYKGKVVFEKLDAQSHTAEIVASGIDVRGRGGADMRLVSSVKELGPREAEITAVSKVNVTGILAQMGRGMVQDVSDELFKTFSQRVRSTLEQDELPASSTVPAAPSTPPQAAAAMMSTAAASAMMPAAVAPLPPAQAPEALDLGSLGAKAAGRAARRAASRPVVWVGIGILAAIVYAFCH